MTDINVMTTATRLHLAAERSRAGEAPHLAARAIVRAGLHDVRVWLGETTTAAETYQPRHAAVTEYEEIPS